MRNKFIAFAAAFIIAAGAIYTTATAQIENSVIRVPPPQILPKDTLKIQTQNGDITFEIEIAQTPAEQAKGLMHRTSMPENTGMLFIFPDEAIRNFWMKNTLIPLDMIFIGKDGTIRHIHENAIPHDLTNISSRVPVVAVLEINGGLTRKQGITIGDTIHHATFNSKISE